MPTSKDKCLELIEKFYKASSMTIAGAGSIQRKTAIDCALLCVDEILEETKQDKQIQYENGEWSRSAELIYSDYWQSVKQVLLNLKK